MDLLVLVVLAHGGPLTRGILGGSPDAYREAGFRLGTAISSSTSYGTTSAMKKQRGREQYGELASVETEDTSHHRHRNRAGRPVRARDGTSSLLRQPSPRFGIHLVLDSDNPVY
jgi:hypothetical protein